VPVIELGSVMRGRGIVKVLQSTSPQFKEGQFGYGPVGWSEYSVLDADAVRPITSLPGGLDMTHHIGTLGLTGMTAYYGLVDIVGARRGETVLVSGAAGATGSMAVRIARHLIKAGRVIGIAGTDEKCRWVEKIGADICRSWAVLPPCHSPMPIPPSCSAPVFPLSCRS
jgi:NADPH-dependent curcumin reductase CurA